MKNVYVDIENVKDESDFDVNKVHSAAEDLIKKIGHIGNIEFLKIHVKKHNKTGKRAKYGIHTQISSSIGLFESTASDWSLVTASQEALDNLEKEILKKHERSKK